MAALVARAVFASSTGLILIVPPAAAVVVAAAAVAARPGSVPAAAAAVVAAAEAKAPLITRPRVRATTGLTAVRAVPAAAIPPARP